MPLISQFSKQYDVPAIVLNCNQHSLRSFLRKPKERKNKDNDIGNMSQSIGNVSSQTRVKIIYHKTLTSIYICIWYRFQKMQRTVNCVSHFPFRCNNGHVLQCPLNDNISPYMKNDKLLRHTISLAIFIHVALRVFLCTLYIIEKACFEAGQ